MKTKAFLQLCFVFFSLSIVANNKKNTIQQTNQDIETAISLMFAKNHTESLALLVKAEALAARENWYQQQFKATLNIGANYYLMSDFGEALNYYLQAYDLALNESNQRNEMIVVNNIAILYFEEGDLEQALIYFTKAYTIAHSLEEEDRIGFYAVNMALVSNKLNQIELAKKYIAEALPLVDKNPRVATLTQLAQAENLFLSGNIKKAQQTATKLMPQLTGPEHKENRVFIWMLLSKIEEHQKNHSKAIDFAMQASKEYQELDNNEEAYTQLAKLHTQINRPNQALQYKDSILVALKTRYEKQNNTNYENSKIKFELQTYTHELQQSRLKHQQEKQWLIASGIAIGCVLLAMLWLYRNNAIKHKQREQIGKLQLEKQKSDYLIKENKLKEKEALALLEKQRLQNELEVKNRKLTAEALYLSNRNELVEEIITNLSNQKQIGENTLIRKKLFQLKKHLKKDEKWKQFNILFEEINYDFLKKLQTKHPNLTGSDVQYLSYLYMNLTNKEIAAIINISPDSCRKRKERILKKIDLPKNISLYSYLTTL